MAAEGKTHKPKAPDVVTRDCTIQMSKRLKGYTFKKRAPRAIREIKKFAFAEMKTSDIRVSRALNEHVWSKGVKSIPTRIRVRLSRRRNDNEDAKEKMYTLVDYVPCKNMSGLGTETVEEE